MSSIEVYIPRPRALCPTCRGFGAVVNDESFDVEECPTCVTSSYMLIEPPSSILPKLIAAAVVAAGVVVLLVVMQ